MNGTCVAGGDGGSGDDGSGDDGSGDDGSGDDGSGGGGSGSSGDGGSAGDDGVDSTGSVDPSLCDPSARLFDGDPLQASISIDEGAMSCAAHSQLGPDPLFQLDVRSTGLVDVKATGGITIGTSSQGTKVNNENVTGITTNLLVEMEATSPGGTPIHLEFYIDEVGPQITMCKVVWNP